MLTIGFIGAGHMAQAMMKGWQSLDEVAQLVYSPNSKERVAQALGIQAAPSLEALFQQSDMVVLAMPPAQLVGVAATIKPLLAQAPQKIIVSVLGGVSLEQLQASLGQQSLLVRALPNVNVAVQQGYTAVAFGPELVADIKGAVFGLLAYLGRADELPETQFGAVSALAGSGPAFVAGFIDDLAQAVTSQGIETDVAYKIALQTVNGTVAALTGQELGAIEFAKTVMTPGGSTEAGWAVMQKQNMAATVAEIIAATMQKNAEFETI
ncbi:MAG: NAD(P)-binding domain-containing protein [Lactobacillaceae bacterium]|jgi:pyrroline-5-carboxylate reductase|nr:NAD(P)-binding domain-containing protein [Lactobacillaceae bacterium]